MTSIEVGRQLSMPLEGLDQQLCAYIDSTRDSTGGWGDSPGHRADPESTAWVLALHQLSQGIGGSGWGDARDWLLRQQQPDGSWTMRNGPAFALWPTFPALFALSTVPDGDAEVARARERATTWALAEHSLTAPLWHRLMQRVNQAFGNEPNNTLDASLDGFNWARGTFAWVEPTAFALLALHSQPAVPVLSERLAVAVRMLLDRQTVDGGWNAGNTRTLGYDLVGHPDTTCWALLALRAGSLRGLLDPAAPAPVTARAFGSLAMAEQSQSPLTLALELLARREWAMPSSRGLDAEMRLRTERALMHQRAGYPLVETRTAVLVLLALRGVRLLRTAGGASRAAAETAREAQR